jgi:pimeloyl-ACP methyl ester carboxylesterase
MRRHRRPAPPSCIVAASLALVGLVAGCSTMGPGGATGSSTTNGPTATTATTAAATPSAGTDVLADIDIGDGRTMHILCVGPIVAGGPTVIFESGLGGDAGQWSDVIHELDGSARACAYDRAGDGQSPAAPGGRTTKDQVADLRALLAAADVPPPYLLVGYSVGAWNVLVHADEFPADVVGAVLAEARPPTASREWLKALPPESATESEAIKGAREESTTFDTDPTLNPEGLRLDASADQAMGATGFVDKPLVVLASADTVGIAEGFEPSLGARMVDVWWTLQEDLASRSTAGSLRKVTGATHEIIFERPDAVADAIREVLGS